MDVSQFQQLKDKFLLEIKNIVGMNKISAELVINFDQTTLSYVPTSHWTMEQEGTKRVEIIAKNDKTNYSGFCRFIIRRLLTTTNNS